MKRFFITILFASLFVTASSVWASGDNQQDKAPVAKEKVEKKGSASKNTTPACCAEKKASNNAKAGESKGCCSEKKASCGAKAKETKAGCPGKATCQKAASSCTNTEAAKETTSSGKKAN